MVGIGAIDFILECVMLALAIGLFIWINKIFDIYYYVCLPMDFTLLLCYIAVYAVFELILGGASKIILVLLKSRILRSNNIEYIILGILDIS